MAAETGVVGGLLLVALPLGDRSAPVAAGPDATLAAAGVAALGIHACVDYVLHFPIIPITSAVLAVQRRRARERDRHRRRVDPNPLEEP